MPVDGKYTISLGRIRHSQKVFKKIYGHPPEIPEISQITGLSEENILEALEFGTKSFFVQVNRWKIDLGQSKV